MNSSTSNFPLLKRYSLNVVTVLLLVVVLGGCTASETDSGESGNQSSGTPVNVATVQKRTLEETIQSVGSLRADQTAKISPEIPGTVEEVAFDEGETVAAGDVLVRLDEDTLREQYRSQKYSLEEARANLQNARRTYERNQRLHERDMVSAQALDDARAAFESAKARVNRLEAQVREAKERLQEATIRAPFAGYVGSRDVDAGNYVQPGTTLTVLYKLNPLDVRFTVPERFVGRIRKGQSIKLHVTSRPDTYFPGKVYFVSPSVREQTRDLLVKARVANDAHELKPGAFARVELTLETLKDRPVVPSESLVGTTEGYIVFTVINGKAHRQPVEIGLRKPGWVEIRDGLQPGQTIVQSGHQSVSDGTTVNPVNDNE